MKFFCMIFFAFSTANFMLFSDKCKKLLFFFLQQKIVFFALTICKSSVVTAAK